MDPNPVNSGTAPSGPDRKKLLIIGGGLILVTVFVVASIFLSPGAQTPESSDTSPSNSGTPGASGRGSPTETPDEIPAVSIAAKSFYDWYVSRADTLSQGLYKTRNDITDEYKALMEAYVLRGLPTGRDPVFNCGDYPLTQKVRALPPEYDELQQQALVTLQEV